MTRFAFFEGKIRPIEDARVSVMTHAFNYGTGWFGGLRGYWNEEQAQLYVFRIQAHYRRFLNSGRILFADPGYSAEQLADITLDLLHREGSRQACYIRPLAYTADEIIGVRLPALHHARGLFGIAHQHDLEFAEFDDSLASEMDERGET